MNKTICLSMRNGTRPEVTGKLVTVPELPSIEFVLHKMPERSAWALTEVVTGLAVPLPDEHLSTAKSLESWFRDAVADTVKAQKFMGTIRYWQEQALLGKFPF